MPDDSAVKTSLKRCNFIISNLGEPIKDKSLLYPNKNGWNADEKRIDHNKTI